MFKMGKKGHNIWKFWQKCTKSEFSFGKKDRGLHVIFDKFDIWYLTDTNIISKIG